MEDEMGNDEKNKGIKFEDVPTALAAGYYGVPKSLIFGYFITKFLHGREYKAKRLELENFLNNHEHPTHSEYTEVLAAYEKMFGTYNEPVIVKARRAQAYADDRRVNAEKEQSRLLWEAKQNELREEQLRKNTEEREARLAKQNSHMTQEQLDEKARIKQEKKAAAESERTEAEKQRQAELVEYEKRREQELRAAGKQAKEKFKTSDPYENMFSPRPPKKRG
jgi:hypothetical protein